MNNPVSQVLLSLALTCAATASMAAGDPQRGETLAQAACVACHGLDGNSSVNAFPKLASLGEKYIYKQLRNIKNAGPANDPKQMSRPIPEMVGILDNNSDQDLQDMAAYYAGKTMQISGAKQEELLVNSGEKVDSLKLGARIYRAGNLETGVPACTGCHSPRGLGNSPAGYPRLSGQHASYIQKQLEDFRAGRRVNDGESRMMRGVAANMTDAEIAAVANFIAGLN